MTLYGSPAEPPDSTLDSLSKGPLPLRDVLIALPWVLLSFVCWLGTQMLRQHGRLLLKLDSLEARVSEGLARLEARLTPPTAQPSIPALPIGEPAPAFDLPDLNGAHKSLADFRGRPVLLVFFNPGCGFCTQMAPALAELPVDGTGGRPIPLVITTGGASANERLVAEFDLRAPVLLQTATETATAYGASGTPMGYLIDADGKVASDLAVGADALLALAEPGAAEPAIKAYRAIAGNKTLADSKIARSGLASGTPAPDLTLPLLDGGEVTLSNLRGKRVLLVFSDPHCGPCMALAPDLERAKRDRDDVSVLMVSRGSRDDNLAKVREFGLTFPIALQKKWEISKLYAMFATPIGYLIDEKGVVASEVAIGAPPILDLLV